MPHHLPESLYIRNRLTQTDDIEFRLTPAEKQRLLAQGTHDKAAPPPTAPDEAIQDPFQLLPWAYQYLGWLTPRLLELDDAEAQVRTLATRLISSANHAPEATLAASLLLPYASYAQAHAVHVAVLIARLASRLSMTDKDSQTLVCAGLTMNVSMVELQDELNRQAAPLSTLQVNQLHLHPLASSAILREANIDDPVWHLAIIEHHERWNGKGYPFALEREAISAYAHILHVADVAMARLHPRHYRRSLVPRNAMAQLFQQRDILTDSRLTDCLIKEIGLYPPGSFVKLEHGGSAIVVHHSDNITSPLCVRLGRDASRTPQPQKVVGSVEMTVEARHLPALASLWNGKIVATAAR
ncbi:MAG TPA: HD domain-containing phosphohydrolase [Chromobacteriaceae bacterium]|nr:HD domain-containing phosphohydrolase [Chromobacteriaceae bacterium]